MILITKGGEEISCECDAPLRTFHAERQRELFMQSNNENRAKKTHETNKHMTEEFCPTQQIFILATPRWKMPCPAHPYTIGGSLLTPVGLPSNPIRPLIAPLYYIHPSEDGFF